MTTTATKNFDKTVGSMKVTGTLHANRLLVGDGWKSYTPTFTNFTLGATGTSAFKYHIIGTTLHVKGGLTAISGTTSGAYYISLPSGCTAISTPGAATRAMGAAQIAGSTVMGIGVTVLATTTSFGITYQNAATTTAVWGNATSNADIKTDVGGVGVTMYCDASIELDPTCAALTGLQP